MKRAIIIHGYGCQGQHAWYPWLKNQLEQDGIQVLLPDMPNTNAPQRDEWVNHLSQLAGEADEELILIGHSLGCITILRYLEKLSGKIGAAFLVAAPLDNAGFEELNSFFEAPLNFEQLKQKAHHFFALNSDDDVYIPVVHGETLRDQLGAELLLLQARGHFSGALDQPGACTELPELLQAIHNTPKS